MTRVYWQSRGCCPMVWGLPVALCERWNSQDSAETLLRDVLAIVSNNCCRASFRDGQAGLRAKSDRNGGPFVRDDPDRPRPTVVPWEVEANDPVARGQRLNDQRRAPVKHAVDRYLCPIRNRRNHKGAF